MSRYIRCCYCGDILGVVYKEEDIPSAAYCKACYEQIGYKKRRDTRTITGVGTMSRHGYCEFCMYNTDTKWPLVCADCKFNPNLNDNWEEREGWLDIDDQPLNIKERAHDE